MNMTEETINQTPAEQTSQTSQTEAFESVLAKFTQTLQAAMNKASGQTVATGELAEAAKQIPTRTETGVIDLRETPEYREVIEHLHKGIYETDMLVQLVKFVSNIIARYAGIALPF
jgi:hypothetical protein